MSVDNMIEKVFNKTTCSNAIHKAVLFVEDTKGDFSASYGYGGMDKNSPFFMASVTKLFITTIILILREQKKISLDALLGEYLDNQIIGGLHIYKQHDYSHKLTVANLLFQTSGLPDGLEEGGFIKRLVVKDADVTYEEVLNKTKELHPRFAPNTANKAYYSDTNFRLLANIIENVAEMPLSEAYKKFICNPLGMSNTYLPVSHDDFIPKIYYKNNPLFPQKFLTSSYNYDAISTAEDMMLFIKAFWNGILFPKSIFDELSVYRKLQITMGPLYYGGGYMQIPMPSLYSLFMGKGELIGHSGSTGSFAFYYPFKDLYFVGDVNQMSNPGIPISLVMKLSIKTHAV